MSKLFYAVTAAAAIATAAYTWAAEQQPVATPKSDKLESVGGVTFSASCTIASVAPDRTVTVDWKCADEFADGDPLGTDGALFAIILKAVRDGKAVSK